MWERIEPKLQDAARRAGLSDVPPAVFAAMLVLSAVACVWALWRWWPQGETQDTALATPSHIRSNVDSVAVSAEATQQMVVVHVVGAVRRPGVYEVPSGSRVIDAIESAGGLLPDAVASSVNLARVLADGEQIAIPDQDDPAPPVSPSSAPGVSAGAAAQPGALVDINSADTSLLDTLPGVGPSTAQKIVADREANGPFGSVEDLGRVSGIGEKKLEQLKGLVSAN